MLLVKNSKAYDILKYLAQIVLPGLGVLYLTIGQIWGLPNAEQVSATILALDLFLGALLGISSKAYKKSNDRFDGEINVFETEDKKQFTIDVHSDPYELDQKDEVVLKINSSLKTPQS